MRKFRDFRAENGQYESKSGEFWGGVSGVGTPSPSVTPPAQMFPDVYGGAFRYKILFLDVLFPLDVKKIIFVDADQVVRTDMMELMTFHLEGPSSLPSFPPSRPPSLPPYLPTCLTGAPYGYTPFCESRKEMEGFRFWKRGYWANHLGPRRYHIR